MTRDLFAEFAAKSGCIEYSTAIDVAAAFPDALPVVEDVVTITEHWETWDAYLAHTRSDSMARGVATSGHLVRGIDVQLLEVV